ncbi:hypothetical protein HU200_048649 [Digitaria exilis]|uniref:F-box domain-containing protein n=1 Tax=Digitaria exilis TaxID=1010633 RepID=A0A835E7J4_9POAL|nr:hypothetical protein HU200_048649 [Digitaria exilis]
MPTGAAAAAIPHSSRTLAPKSGRRRVHPCQRSRYPCTALMASGEDSISGLPDELLHAILFRVRSSGDAVRTSVLSRRWRHILVRPLPELVFEEVYFVPVPEPAPPPRLESFLDNVDAALAACDAPVIKGLRIVWRWCAPWSTAAASRFPTGRVEPWLRFASERVVDDLRLEMSPRTVDGEEPVLELPLCEWVKKIDLGFREKWRIRLPSAGLFRALADLTIRFGRMDGSELTTI